MKTNSQSDPASEKSNSLPDQNLQVPDSNPENSIVNPKVSDQLSDIEEIVNPEETGLQYDEMSTAESNRIIESKEVETTETDKPATTEKNEPGVIEVDSDITAEVVSEAEEDLASQNAAEENKTEVAEEIESPADTTSPEPVVEPVENVSKDIKASETSIEEPAEAQDVDVSEEEESDDQEEEGEEENLGSLEGMSREELVAKLEGLVKEEDVTKIKGEISAIKVAFLKLNKEYKHEAYQKLVESTNDPEAEGVDALVIPDDEVEEKFKAAFQIYKQNKFRFNESQEKLKIQNLEAKNKILEELKALINSEETLKKTYDEFKVLQDRWKTIGMVPKAEINNLWQNYHFLVEKFFDKVKINKELKDLDLKKNLEAKIELCGKAEELLLETSIIKSFKSLQQYHEEWKEIGPVPQDKKDELWDRFRSATDKINDRRREYYNEMQEGLEQNYSAKTILCEKAEQLVASEYDTLKSWQDATNQMTELLQIWKTLGPAPKKQNNEIWARFKVSLDAFFNAKKDFYNKLKEQQMHNYNLKLDLCLQAEALRTSTDWRNTTRELINMQNEWKKLGPVPRKQSDKIWKRFRAACDEFFASKNEYFKNISGHEEENMKLKLELIEKAKAFEIGDSRNEAIETLKEFQRQWMDIGHVPIKEKEKLQTEFRSIINSHFEKLKMDSVSIGSMNYRSRVDRIAKESPDAGKIISKERSYLQGKIQQLQDEIKTWENNIGFFANSKTANLLKQEFEKKIEKAKEELLLLNEKLKMLREANQ